MRKRTRRDVLGYTTVVCSAVVFTPIAPSLGFAANEGTTEHKIAIKSFQFEPEEISIKVGDTVTWTNFDIVPHTATAKDGSWDTETLETGQSMQIIVTEGMDRAYFCVFHPHMKASLRII